MPSFIYKARDAAGKSIQDSMEAANSEEVLARLRSRGLLVTKVTRASAIIKKPSTDSSLALFLDRLTPISTDTLVSFNIQLSNLVNAGISLLDSLILLYNQIENKRLKKMVTNMARDIEGGASFSQALGKYPETFPLLYVSMVKAGEAGGNLDIVLVRYAAYAESQSDLKKKIGEALFYPLTLLVLSIGVILFIVTSVIPKFMEIYLAAKIDLPLFTLILYKTGTGLKKYWYLIFFFVLATWLGLRYYLRTKQGRFLFDKFKLKIPVVGPLFRQLAISRFARTMGTLVSSGVPVLETLDIVKDVIGNEVLKRTIEEVSASVERGEKIGEHLKRSGQFPPDTVQMITVGEETGNLDLMLNKVADFYTTSLGYAIRRLTTVFEQISLMVIGLIITLVMLSLILPLFNMIKILKR